MTKQLWGAPILCLTSLWAVAGFPQNSNGSAPPPVPPRGSPPALSGQTSVQKGPGSVDEGFAQFRALITESESADTQEGNRVYTKHLAEMLAAYLGEDAHLGRNTYIEAFAGRLSTVDMMARRGERNLVPESVVVQAFNDLMSRVHAPLRTDTNVVHILRNTLYAVSPSFSTVNSDSSECLPSEAVHIMVQLVLHNGSLKDLCPPEPDANGRLVQHACPGSLNAEIVISRYTQSRSASRNAKLLDHVAKLFGI